MQDNTHQAPKLLDQLRDKVRLKHYSLSTERQYIHWAKRFILFHEKRHPKDQALSALLFLYREVLVRMQGTHGLMTRMLYGTRMR